MANLTVNDLSSIAYPPGSETTVSLILLYDASNITTSIYQITDSSTPLLTVNSYIAKYAATNGTLNYYEIDGEITFPGPILPNSGVGNIYIQVPFIDLTESAVGVSTITPFTTPENVDVLVSLTANGTTSHTPVYSVNKGAFGLYGQTSANTSTNGNPALIVPLSVFFTNINMVNTIYRFIIKIYPQT